MRANGVVNSLKNKPPRPFERGGFVVFGARRDDRFCGRLENHDTARIALENDWEYGIIALIQATRVFGPCARKEDGPDSDIKTAVGFLIAV